MRTKRKDEEKLQIEQLVKEEYDVRSCPKNLNLNIKSYKNSEKYFMKIINSKYISIS